MKKFLLVGLLSASLCSCSLLQRHSVDDEETVRDLEPGQEPPGAVLEGEVEGSAGASVESEVSKLNTKIAALETKIDVLSAGMERIQAQKSQPVIQAEMPPETNMAAPVDLAQDNNLQETLEQPPQISAAPARPTALPVAAREADLIATTAAEKEFRAGMQLFQSGRNLEAASRFALMAKKFPQHLLASHALYWAGEANARGQQFAIAIENWIELEKKYPRSAYLPEAFAGLANAYDSQGDAAKSKQYRMVLARSFPHSPVALKLAAESTTAGESVRSSPRPAQPTREEESVPSYSDSEGANENASETQ